MEENENAAADSKRPSRVDPITRLCIVRARAAQPQLSCAELAYALARNGATLQPTQEERMILAWIRELRGRGLTLENIATHLSAEGLTTRRGSRRKVCSVHHLLVSVAAWRAS